MLRFSTAANQDSSVTKRLCVGGGGVRRHRRVKHILRRYTLHVCSRQPASLAQHDTSLCVCVCVCIYGYLLISSQLLCRFAPRKCACETADRVLVAASARIKWT